MTEPRRTSVIADCLVAFGVFGASFMVTFAMIRLIAWINS